jgi:hypothetical protein
MRMVGIIVTSVHHLRMIVLPQSEYNALEAVNDTGLLWKSLADVAMLDRINPNL